MKNNLRKYLFLALFVGLIVLLDQITKSLVRSNIELWTGVWSPWKWLLPYARIVHVPNTGVAFGMFQGQSYLFTGLISVVILFLIYFYSKIPERDYFQRAALIFYLGGAIGNLIDRIRIGHVTDFISIGNFAIFNIADACINIAVAIFIIGFILDLRREKKNKSEGN